MTSESTEEIAHVHFFLSSGLGLLGLGSLLLLGLLFFRGLLLGSRGSGSSGCGACGANALLSVSDQLVEGLALEGVDNSLDVLVGSVRADGSKEGLDVIGGWIDLEVLMSFLPPRANRA